MNKVDELFSDDSRLPHLIRYILYLIKKIFCILTIKENGICILPYKKLENRIIIKMITKIIKNNTKQVVLSKYLSQELVFNMELSNRGIFIFDGMILSNYLLYFFIDYISKMKNENTETQEVFILVNTLNDINESIILDLANRLKRVDIVTKSINKFKRIEHYLEEQFGIAITVTNNKRKSLRNARIIINLDFNEEELNTFNIAYDAIVINTNKKIPIKCKLFNGVNVLDYQIIYDTNVKFEEESFKNFDRKIIYESTIAGKRYCEIVDIMKQDNLKIVNLIGKNGIINWKLEARNWKF